MPKLQDLTGLYFGSWYVLRRGENSGPTTRWLCRCVCGTEKLVHAGHLVKRVSTNCGCQRKPSIKHGGAIGGRNHYSQAYRSWRSMRSRIFTKSHKDYWRYGGRGIKICDRWRHFDLFLEDMGQAPSNKHSIDRIDNDGDYCPENCRWATQSQQVAELPQNQRGYKHKTRHGKPI